METIFTLLKDNALVAVMFLITALYLGGDNQVIRSDMAAIRTEMAAIRTEMAAIRTDVTATRADIAAVRAEMAANNQAIRTEMAEEFKAVRAEIANTNERLARVETRLDSIEDRLYMDTARPPM
ncbi:MAG: hypothetical protein F4Z71_03680 [Gammaproteobacteria bacterium]|nr:hypothetical protein [Gammaproteobacteria bacterium]MYE28973.1 hypothetical protein [Gammaproteobacteria bacterium]